MCHLKPPAHDLLMSLLMQDSSDAKPAEGKENSVLTDDTVSLDSPASSDASNSRVDDVKED